MQPDALNATVGPKGPLAWGQLNFIHTTDTHGWLEGHIKEQNYGADWGDFASFVKHMKDKATSYGVDLLVIDTGKSTFTGWWSLLIVKGDLHDGAGLSDATLPDGVVSNRIFENIDYDLLTIGNHELYLTDIAYETKLNFSQYYGDKYLTSNVQILNNATGQFEYIGKQYRYFTTALGLRIMSFGVLYDFTGNTNYTQVIPAANMTQEQWFIDAVNTPLPVDLFLLIGHNPVHPSDPESTIATVQQAIRQARPTTPIQVFGGHSHIRDLAVYDSTSVGLESGRYCETMGWLSMSGIQSTNCTGLANPVGVPNPTQPAVNLTAGNASVPVPAGDNLVYFRRYIDWNRLSFEYHAVGSQASTFDVTPGTRVTVDITDERYALNLTQLFGCAPQTYCITCAPYLSNGSIYSLVQVALGAEVVNASRSTIPRLIIVNTGGIRFDLVQGPFTYDDSFIVSPFTDTFVYLPNISYTDASQVLDMLNAAPSSKKRSIETKEYTANFNGADGCYDTPYMLAAAESQLYSRAPKSKTRRQAPALTPGYVTSDDFGTDGDDTPHTAIPSYPLPGYVQGNASFPTTGLPTTVDLVFLDYIASNVLPILASLGMNYSESDVTQYLPVSFTTQDYLPLYAKQFWSPGPNCSVGQGIP